MRILVCGGRDFNDVPRLWRALDRILIARRPIDLVIEGASDDVTGPYVGADYWAYQWAQSRDLKTARVHAEWKTQGRSAGPIRNQKMLDDYYPQLVIAFPGQRGTENMKTLAKKAGIEVVDA